MFPRIFICFSMVWYASVSSGYYRGANEGRLKSQFRDFPGDHAVPEYMGYGCNDVGNILCAREMNGYHVCEPNDEKGPVHRCPPGTHCGCHLDGPCHLNASEVCVPFASPIYPMPEQATFYFKGWDFLNHNTWSGQLDRKERLPQLGVVKQDVREGKYLQITTNKRYPYNTFELIKPDGNGRYTKYVGVGGKCRTYTIRNFQPFGYDIKNYHLHSSKPLTANTTEQLWHFKVGFDTIVWVSLKWKWRIISDAVNKVSLPVYSYFYEAGDYTPDKHEVYWKVAPLDAPIGEGTDWYGNAFVDGDWFNVPEICIK